VTEQRQDLCEQGVRPGQVTVGDDHEAAGGQGASFVVRQAAMGRQRFGVTLRRPGLVPGRMGRADVQACVVGGR